MKRTLREKTFPLTHTSLPSSDPRRCRKRSLGGFALKCTLAQSVERTIALKAKPVAIKNSALLPHRQEPHFSLKHAHFGAHPEHVMPEQTGLHLNGVSHNPRRAGHGDQVNRFYLGPPGCEEGLCWIEGQISKTGVT